MKTLLQEACHHKKKWRQDEKPVEIATVLEWEQHYDRILEQGEKEWTTDLIPDAPRNAEDVARLTPTQIRDKFALPAIPKYITDVNIPANTVLRTGIVNPLEGWGIGGGVQFDLMGQRIGEFTNSRILP